MGIKKVIINIILRISNIFVLRFKIKTNQIAFVSLESSQLESDLKLIYEKLVQNKNYQLKTVLINYNKKSLLNNFLYMLNCIKQIYIINTSKLVLITDNNYVISNFKRPGVTVLQIWHATGAIKKFGNAIKREYPIKNYDYVISNSDYWKEPYHQSFAIASDHVITTGMPRVDHLFDKQYLNDSKVKLIKKYPVLKDKKVILYAPTFRGNLYTGFKTVAFDALKLIEALGDEYVLVYKFHPLLLNTKLASHPRIINLNNEDTHELFALSDLLISDFSSIIFDYSLLNKPMHFFVPDLDDYLDTLGCFVDYQKTMPGAICQSIDELIEAVKANKQYPIDKFAHTFFKYHDGNNTNRVIALIDNLMKK
ncbi:CDP-glycerol glycerophosphotransferase family protein [Thomasclavelia sp.]|uniref:CDP-glycerol glycerophosphotransferase family protein n=1 Tax=Thomasclavelia sp. TaxID=3025757 RepID=UPI0025D08D5F|nr:CDP-glycerol glycerophosphotransferase family protein [Thomasclavelia sp.]